MPRLPRIRFQLFKDYAWAKWPFCQWCGRDLARPDVTADHVKPRACGGEDSWDNLVIACSDCNERRGSKPDPAHAPTGPRWSLAEAEAELATFKPKLWQTSLTAPLPLPPELGFGASGT